MALSIVLTLALSGADRDKDKDKRPKISVRASPAMGISPARVVASADLNGGANDYEEFYCPSIEWDWGDDTRSTTSADCEPYEAGKSEIKRRFTVEHMFRRPDNYRVAFRLKRRDKGVGFATVQIQVRPGLPDGF